MHGVQYDGRYYGFYENESKKGGFIFDVTDDPASFVYTDLHYAYSYSDEDDDRLYFIDNASDSILEWNAAKDNNYTRHPNGIRTMDNEQLLTTDGEAIIWAGGVKNISLYDATMLSTWVSGTHITARPECPGVVMISGDQSVFNPVTFRLYAAKDPGSQDKDLVATLSITSTKPYSLPRGYKATDFRLSVTGRATIDRIQIAQTRRQLRLT
jgi:hypothetical protein